LAPHSPGTDQIDTLLWIGFVVAAILIVAINGALIYAVRRYRGERGAEPRQVRGSKGTQLRVGGLLTVFAAAILVVSLVYTDKARETPTTGPAGLASAQSKPLRIDVTGQQWLWRYDYPNEAFSYYKLVVPVDTTVELDLVSTDVIHTWDVPQLAGKRDAVPGKTNHVVTRKASTTASRRPSPARPTRRCGPRSTWSRQRSTKTSSPPRRPASRLPRTASSA
jgi:cytochrome c oxidase subunit 2